MTVCSDIETKILEDFLHHFLPDGLLEFYEPVMAEDKGHQIKNDEVYKRELHLYFDERDNRTPEMQNLRPNGFTEERTMSDLAARSALAAKSRHRSGSLMLTSSWGQKSRINVFFTIFTR